MVTRRAILLGGLSIPILATAGGTIAPTFATKRFNPCSARPFVSHALFEAQATEAQQFGRVFDGVDSGVHGVQGDIADFWYVKTHYGAEKRRPQNLRSIAGMTLPGAAFCLEVLGRDLRMAMVLRIDHRWARDGSMHHTLFGPDAVVESIATHLRHPSPDWPEAIGTTIRGLTALDLAGDSIVRELTAGASLRDSASHLTTWVLAPVRSELLAAAG